jgi:hypothetical protein
MPGRFKDFKGDIYNLLDVLKWIKENVPCFTGKIPAEWTRIVYDEAKLRNMNRTVVQAALATALGQGYQFDLTETESDVASMSNVDKIKAAIICSGSYLPADMYNVVQALAEPKSLAIMAGTLIAWAGSHAFGVGEIVDVILLGVGIFYIGFSVFAGADELIDFVKGALGASTHADLDAAGHHFARAVTLLGIATIQALLMRGPVKAARNRSPIRLPPPPGRPPTTTYVPRLSGGSLGRTTAYGDIEVSLAQSLSEQRLTLFHELVHRFFTPKMAALRQLRAELRLLGYNRSAFLRYLEEALAEGWGQLREHGLLSSLKGLYFPITNGYVTLSQIVTGGNLIGTIMLGGRRIYVYISTGQMPVEAK